MEVDKTLSELWHLRGNTDGPMTREEFEKEAKDTAYMAINTIKKLQEEISLLKASRGASIHEYCQLFNERMKFKEENEFLKDDIQIRDERIKELEKELHELKNDVTHEDIKRVETILDRGEDLCEEHADDKEWLVDKFKQRAASKS